MRRTLITILGIFLLITSCNCGGPAVIYRPPPDVTDQSFSEVYSQREGRRNSNRVLTSYMSDRTVSIQRDCTPKKDAVIITSSNPKRMNDGRGTGIIVRSKKLAKKSYIFTAAHVVRIQSKKQRPWFNCKITVQKDAHANTGDWKYKAKLLVWNDKADYAVLEVDGDLGVGTELEVNPFTGEDVWAVGYPVQMVSRSTVILSITKGTLATKNVPGHGNPGRYGYYHRVTSQVYFGNSGGGIWTKEGKLTAIVVMLYAAGGKIPFEGYYYVKPVNEVLQLLKRRWKYDLVFGEDRPATEEVTD